MKRILSEFSAGFALVFLILAGVIILLPVPVHAVDMFMHDAVIPLQTLGWSTIFLVITTFGNAATVAVIFIIMAYIYRHRPDLVARLLLALLGATVTSEYIKNLLQRARPETLSWLPAIHSYSFPSGHATESMVLYGFIGVLLFIHARSRVAKMGAIAFSALIILLVGFSRIVLNYHYFTDVLGGYMLGSFWLSVSFSIPLYRSLYHRDDLTHTEPITYPLV